MGLQIHWERWKTWKEHPEYKVSSDGRIKKNGKLVKQKISTGGYMLLDLENGNSQFLERYVIVHRLVCHVFKGLDLTANEPTVDHLNHNKRDNSLRNLEIVSGKENCKRAKHDLIEIGSMPNLHDAGETNELFNKKLQGIYVITNTGNSPVNDLEVLISLGVIGRQIKYSTESINNLCGNLIAAATKNLTYKKLQFSVKGD